MIFLNRILGGIGRYEIRMSFIINFELRRSHLITN